MSYDEEAIYQEDDILQAQYEGESRDFWAMKDKGYCMHESGVGYAINPETGKVYYPEQEGLTGTQQRCTAGCGQVFESIEALYSAEPTLMVS